MPKPSELFEGENSSLRKTYDSATQPQESWSERFDKKWNQKEANRIADERGVVDLASIKSFIASEIAAAEKRARFTAIAECVDNIIIKFAELFLDKSYHHESLIQAVAKMTTYLDLLRTTNLKKLEK